MRITLLVVFALVAAGRQTAEACTCAPSGPPCQAYWQVDAVFVGRVASIASATESKPFAERTVTFAVVEALKAVTTKEVVVRTGRGGGDCGYNFVTGATYVVYAHRNPQSGALSTSICSRTRPLDAAAADAEYGRAVLAGTEEPGRVTGRAAIVSESLQPRSRPPAPKPLAGVRITVTRESTSYVAVSGDDGTFTFEGLPPGKYSGRVEAPTGYLTRGFPREFELRDARACAELDIPLSPDGRVSGRVVNGRREPVPGLTIDLTIRRGLDDAFGPRRLRTTTTVDGSYEFAGVSPGRYVVGLNTQLDRNNQPSELRAFLPGVHEAAGAREIVVGAGERVRADDFVLPDEIRYVGISGVVLEPDGGAAAGVRVYLKGVAQEEYILTEPAITDAQGRFIIAGVEGKSYLVFAERVRAIPGGSNRIDVSDQLSTTPMARASPVVLRLERRH